MQLSWLRPNIGDPYADSQIIYSNQKQQSMSIKLNKSASFSTTYHYNLDIEKINSIIENVDQDLLHEKILLLLCQKYQTQKDWFKAIQELIYSNQFFNDNIADLFLQLEDKIFQQKETYYIQTLIITLEFYMKMPTLIYYLYWRYQKYPEQVCLIEDCLTTLVQIRYLYLNVESHFYSLIQLLFDGKLCIPQQKKIKSIPKLQVSQIKIFYIFDIPPNELADSLTIINEEFYSEIKFHLLLTRLDNDLDTDFMKDYFWRINSFSLYIQLCILREKNKRKAIKYFYDVCVSLCENEDQEGVFLVYHLSLERIDSEFLRNVQYISDEQQMHIKELIKQCTLDYRHVYTNADTKKVYPIPSFHNFWIAYKKIESHLKSTKNLEALEPLRKVLSDLHFIRQTNYARLQNEVKQIDKELKHFLLIGHQVDLSLSLKIENGNWNQMQIALMKMVGNF